MTERTDKLLVSIGYHWRPILITLALITVLIWVLALTQPRRLVEGVFTLNLTGGCRLDYHANIHAVALACPGVDYTRLWPLPVKQPWQERRLIRCRVGMRGDETPL